MKKIPLLLILTIQLTLLPFGKNKVQYHSFDWKFIETEHLRIYFYQGGEMLADFTASVGENSLLYLKKDMMYMPSSKINLIVYNSHSHFEETNVMGGIPEESVGGFTEFFKNRVVVPYQGNWEEFRHVIHHELTHAIMNQLLFRGNYQAIVTGLSKMNMPLWFIEGIAEYQSRGGWDSESDQTIRDAVYNDYIGNVYYLNNYMAYKGGQSLFKYIADTYGSKKIGEILRGINVIRSVEDAFLDAIGTNFVDLSKNWHRWLKTKYWSTLIQTDEPGAVATKLSDHEKWGNGINNSPVISPDGKKIVFLSNKSDYFDIYLVRTFDGEIIRKIVSGQSTGDFESFKWLRPGFAWSPDSRYIAFFAKSTDSDAVFIYEAETGKRVMRQKFDLDGVYYPEWSKDGENLCFTGIKDGYSDLFLYNIKTKELKKLTDDIYSDNEPRFSPDGKKIMFSSDRKEDLSSTEKSLDKVIGKNLNVKDIYILDLETSLISRETGEPESRQYSPFWFNADRIGFISDRTGIANIYFKDLSTGETFPITNFMTGCSHVSYNDNKIAFTAVFKAGYDIYMIEDAERLISNRKHPQNVRWYDETDLSGPPSEKDQTFDFVQTDLRKFKFSKNMLEKTADEVLTDDQKTELRKAKPYDLRFSPDVITVNAGYTSSYGVSGSTYIQFSDYLSDHSFVIVADLNQDLLNSNIGGYYYYLKKRVNIGMGISHDVVYDSEYINIDGTYYILSQTRDRLLGLHFMAQYPFSRFTRTDSFAAFRTVSNEDYNFGTETYDHVSTQPLFSIGGGFSYDNVIWGYYGPENGTRVRLSAQRTTDAEDLAGSKNGSIEFNTFSLDYRKYFRVKGDYQFAIRLTGALSEGNTPQTFFMGGMSNWLNGIYKDNFEFDSVVDKYYSASALPMRGFSFFERKGNRYGLLNAEFRYPFIKYIALGFPLPIVLGNISGVAFADMGGAWYNSDFKGAVKLENGEHRLKDMLLSSGFGSRMNVGYFILRYDVSWTWDYQDFSSPVHILSLGANF
jgi:Tol biopolymer transport system component